jgi:hypothetical protein
MKEDPFLSSINLGFEDFEDEEEEIVAEGFALGAPIDVSPSSCVGGREWRAFLGESFLESPPDLVPHSPRRQNVNDLVLPSPAHPPASSTAKKHYKFSEPVGSLFFFKDETAEHGYYQDWLDTLKHAPKGQMSANWRLCEDSPKLALMNMLRLFSIRIPNDKKGWKPVLPNVAAVIQGVESDGRLRVDLIAKCKIRIGEPLIACLDNKENTNPRKMSYGIPIPSGKVLRFSYYYVACQEMEMQQLKENDEFATEWIRTNPIVRTVDAFLSQGRMHTSRSNFSKKHDKNGSVRRASQGHLELNPDYIPPSPLVDLLPYNAAKRHRAAPL